MDYDLNPHFPMPMHPTRPNGLPVHIRWMIRRDMPEVLAIEAASFTGGWTEDDFLRCTRQRNVIGMVAEHREKVVGYMIYEVRKHSLLILNLAVHPDLRRRSIGTQMLCKLAGKLSSHRRQRILMPMRETNLTGLLFLRQFGFACIGIQHGYFEDSGEDAFAMEYVFPGVQFPGVEEHRPTNRIAKYMQTDE